MADSVGKVAKRYAQALFDLIEASDRDACVAALHEIVETWNQSSELRMALLNPAFPMDERIAALRSLIDNLNVDLGSHAKDNVKNFLSVVLENGRISDVETLADAFRELVAESQNVIVVTVTSARTLPADERSAIQERVRSACGAKTEISWEEDPELIAGLQIKIGDSVLDSSVRGALGKARAALN